MKEERLKRKKYSLKKSVIVRQLGRKNQPHRGIIPLWLYIVPTDLVSVLLDVGNLQITYKDLPTRFPSFLVQSFKETLQYWDEWRKFTSVSQSDIQS